MLYMIVFKINCTDMVMSDQVNFFYGIVKLVKDESHLEVAWYGQEMQAIMILLGHMVRVMGPWATIFPGI